MKTMKINSSDSIDLFISPDKKYLHEAVPKKAKKVALEWFYNEKILP